LDKRITRLDTLSKIAAKKNPDDGGRYILSTDVYVERVKRISRRRTLDMIKKLEKNERQHDMKEPLRGILNKKCFYTYYRRAADPSLFSIVEGIRQDLLSNSQARF
jgi:hypothetical protein